MTNSVPRRRPRTRAAAAVVAAAAALAASGLAAQQPPARAPQPPAVSAPPAAPGDVTGVWIDHTGQGAVEITPCGDSRCGRVVWLSNPAHKSKRGVPICGQQVIGEVRHQPDGTWTSGWIYNPEDEERFSVDIRLKNINTLEVNGYLGIKLLGETYLWKRATAPLESCDGGRAASQPPPSSRSPQRHL